ncbi:MAG: DJ-1/PfpI family protein [Thermoguttaceae bacterium]
MTTIGMVLFPNLTQLDLTGPYEVFCRMPATRVHLVATSHEPVVTEYGLTIIPDLAFEDAPMFDVLCVPGGPGVNRMLEDKPFLAFLGRMGEQARFVTSVCTGALLLGAAGLLRGYRATTHWLNLDLLRSVGAEPVAERVVVDRNRITAAGVSSGIDLGLVLASLLHGDEIAQEIQLMMEYAPAPSFQAGSPKTAPAEIVQRVTVARQAIQEERRRILSQISSRL